jgi:regulator of sirC expression with transglutaminase-like and TPR domain
MRLGAALLLLVACRREEPAGPMLQALLDVALESGALAAGETAFTRTEITRLAADAAAAVRGGRSPAEALRWTVFEQGRVVRQIDSQEARFMLLPGVLHEHRGTCVGLGTLYLVLAERVGVPAHGVLVPGHFFVRIHERQRLRNVELLRQGEEMPDSWYRNKYGIPASGGDAYLRALTPIEVAAVLRFNLANELREQGRHPEALAKYRRAAADFPGFAEAHASIGLTYHLLGRLDEARRAYQTARRLHPSLPGLDKNLALLEREIQHGK